MGQLDEVDLGLTLARKEEERAAERRLEAALATAADPRRPDRGGELGPPLCVVFEGWDASGKGGAIKRLIAHSTLATSASPSSRRRARTRSATTSSGGSAPALPGWGGMAVFDRSWYGRVLVERVEGFASRGAVAARLRRDRRLRARPRRGGRDRVKFWLQISPEEQLKRFKSAQTDPLKGLEADRRGLAQPREAGRLRGGGRGHDCADEHRAARPGTSSPPTPSATPGSRWSRRWSPRSRRACDATG